MYRKPRDATVSTRTRLRNKETRKLRVALAQQWGCGDDAIQALLPSKADIECIKFHNRSQGFRITGEDQPLFIDVKGKKEYAPTIFGLWRVPNLIKQVFIPSQVSSFVLKGADLMLPGVLVPAAGLDFRKHGMVAVRVAGNPAPIGVGRATMDGTECIRVAMRGRGFDMLHTFGDELWKFGGRHTPPGFHTRLVTPVDSAADDTDADVMAKAEALRLRQEAGKVTTTASDGVVPPQAQRMAALAAAADAEAAKRKALAATSETVDGWESRADAAAAAAAAAGGGVGAGGGAGVSAEVMVVPEGVPAVPVSWEDDLDSSNDDSEDSDPDTAPGAVAAAAGGAGGGAGAGVGVAGETDAVGDADGDGDGSGSGDKEATTAEDEAEEEDDTDDDEDDDDEEEEEDRPPTRFSHVAALSRDELLKEAFLQALKVGLPSDSSFPLPAQKLYEGHMIASLPVGVTLDVRNTRFKSLKKFITAMKKDKVIKSKEHKGLLMVVSVNRNSAPYRAHTPWPAVGDDNGEGEAERARAAAAARKKRQEKRAAAKAAKEAATGKRPGSDGAGDGGGVGDKGYEPPTVVELLKPGAAMVPMVEAACVLMPPDLAKGIIERGLIDSTTRRTIKTTPGYLLYPKPIFLRIVQEYVRAKDLANPGGDTKRVALDMVLSEALFKGSKKKGESYPSSVTKADLYKTMADRCSAFHALRYPGATEPQLRKGAMEPVVLGVKSLQGGRKHITTARNLEVFGINLDKFKRTCTKEFACSAATQYDEGSKTTELVIQGDVMDGLAALLMEKCRLPRKLVQMLPGGRANKRR